MDRLLAKTEKTYIGTKIEHLVLNRSRSRGAARLDGKVADQEVNVHVWSLFSQWEIPGEKP